VRGERADDQNELRLAGTEDQEPGRSEHDDEEVEAAEPGVEIPNAMTFVDHEVDKEHEPRHDEDRGADEGIVAARQQEQRQHCGRDER
jgi:hypothetical protein